jgi:hypothetical protein
LEAYSDRIDCLRSGLDGAADAAGPVLDGLAGCDAGPPPKKSSPNNESPALVCFGGAASAFGGADRTFVGGPVLGRGGAGASSPKRSIAGCCLAWGGGVGRLALAPRRCDADRST